MKKLKQYIAAAVLTGLLLLLSGCSAGENRNTFCYAISDIQYDQYAPYGNPEESYEAKLAYSRKEQTVTVTTVESDKEAITLTHSYDQIIGEQMPDVTVPEESRWSNWKETYDSSGNLLTRENAEIDGTRTEYRYNGNEKPVSCTVIRESDLRTWNYTFIYDGHGRLTEERCEENDSVDIIRWTYDEAGRILEKKYFDVKNSEEVLFMYYIWSYNKAGYLTGYQWYTGEGNLIEEMQVTYDRIWAPSEMTETLIKETVGFVLRKYYQGSQYENHGWRS